MLFRSAVQKLLSLIRSHLFIFAFISFALGDRSQKLLLQFMSKSFLPMFSSLMASCLKFRSLIHFEFIFVYIVRKCSNFILLHVAVQFSQHHLLKRLSTPNNQAIFKEQSWRYHASGLQTILRSYSHKTET